MASKLQALTLVSLPAEGYVRLAQIIGQEEVTVAEAEANRLIAEEQRKANEAVGKKPKYDSKPKRPRQKTPPVIPVSRSTWWAGVKSGRFPKPVRWGRTTLWRVEDIRALIQNAS